MSNSDLSALYQELLAAVLRCGRNLWFCKTCREVVFYDRRSQEPLGVHDAHQTGPIPTLFDQDGGANAAIFAVGSSPLPTWRARDGQRCSLSCKRARLRLAISSLASWTERSAWPMSNSAPARLSCWC